MENFLFASFPGFPVSFLRRDDVGHATDHAIVPPHASDAFSLARSISSKNGVSHNIDAGNLVGLSNVSDYDVTIAKSATLAGQDCECEMSMQNIKSVSIYA